MRHDPAIADTQKCQAIVDRPARHDPDPRDGRSWRADCDLRVTQPLPIFCPEVRPLSQWSPSAIDRLLADLEVAR